MTRSHSFVLDIILKNDISKVAQTPSKSLSVLITSRHARRSNRLRKKALFLSSFPRKRESMHPHRYILWRQHGLAPTWIPAFAGMTIQGKAPRVFPPPANQRQTTLEGIWRVE
jgi:hypothetical protein